MAFRAVLVAAVVAILCGASSASYSDCGSKDGIIVSLEVSDCAPNVRRCILKRNTNATITISFTPKTSSDTFNAVVHGVVMGVPIPFDLPNSNGCKDSGVTCPIEAAKTYKYSTTLPVLGSYPMVTVDIKWELQDAQGNNIICALIPARIR